MPFPFLVVVSFGYVIFCLCAIGAITSSLINGPTDGYPVIIFPFIGSSLGFVLPPRLLRWFAIAAMAACAWQLWEGHVRSRAERQPVYLDYSVRQFTVRGKDASRLTAKSFLSDINSFLTDEGFSHVDNWKGASDRYVKKGNPAVTVLVHYGGYAPTAQYGTIDVFCNDVTTAPIRELLNSLQTNLRDKYTVTQRLEGR
jgi:hypothetical protein